VGGARQLYGIVVVGAWSFVVSGLLLLALGRAMRLRVSVKEEEQGLDLAELDESVVLEQARRAPARAPRARACARAHTV
jgi:ammonia channel protein AmtB